MIKYVYPNDTTKVMDIIDWPLSFVIGADEGLVLIYIDISTISADDISILDTYGRVTYVVTIYFDLASES